MSHLAVPLKDILKAKAAITTALAAIDGLLPVAKVEEPAPRTRKPKTRDEKIVAPGEGFQP